MRPRALSRAREGLSSDPCQSRLAIASGPAVPLAASRVTLDRMPRYRGSLAPVGTLAVLLASLGPTQMSDAEIRICHGCGPPVVICGQAVINGPVGPAAGTESFTRPGPYGPAPRLGPRGLPRARVPAPV